MMMITRGQIDLAKAAPNDQGRYYGGGTGTAIPSGKLPPVGEFVIYCRDFKLNYKSQQKASNSP